jgi:hypothetical protein
MLMNIKNFIIQIRKRLIILFLILSSFIFFNSAKAYEVSYTSETNGLSATANISDDLPYYYITEMTNNLVLYVSSNPFVANYNNDGFFATGQTIYIYRKTAANAWTQYDWSSVYTQNNTGYVGGIGISCANYDTCVSTANTYIKKANHDILYNNTNNIVFANNVSLPTPEISFTSTSNTTTINNESYIYSKDITIDYSIIDNDNYYYMYLDTNENIWHTLYLTDSTSYTFNVSSNTNIIAKVLDKSTLDLVTSSSYSVNDIDYIIDISISHTENYNSFGIVTSSNIKIDYFTSERSLYDFDYYMYDEWWTLDSSLSSIDLNIYDNQIIIARIKDKNSGSVLFTKSFDVTYDIRVPQINFISKPEYSYETYTSNLGNQLGKNCISKNNLYIDYGFLDNTRFTYLYSLDNGSTWINTNLDYNCSNSPEGSSCVGLFLELTSNGYVIARVISNSDNSIVTQATFTINNIGVCNVNSDSSSSFDSNESFNYWSTPIQEFLRIFKYFYNSLPDILHYFFTFIFIFIIMLFALKFLL